MPHDPFAPSGSPLAPPATTALMRTGGGARAAYQVGVGVSSHAADIKGAAPAGLPTEPDRRSDPLRLP